MNGHSQEYIDWQNQEESAQWAEAIRRAVVEDYLVWLNDPVAQADYQEWNDGQIRNR